VLPCVAVCCSMFQCIPACCSVSQCQQRLPYRIACSVLQCLAACCSVLQYVTVGCNVSQCQQKLTCRIACRVSSLSTNALSILSILYPSACTPALCCAIRTSRACSSSPIRLSVLSSASRSCCAFVHMRQNSKDTAAHYDTAQHTATGPLLCCREWPMCTTAHILTHVHDRTKSPLAIQLSTRNHCKADF